MPKFIIERDVPSFGKCSSEEWKGASKKSNEAIEQMDKRIHWIQSFVTDDKVYCVYIAPGKDAVLEHSKKSGFPASRVEEVRTIMDPVTAE